MSVGVCPGSGVASSGGTTVELLFFAIRHSLGLAGHSLGIGTDGSQPGAVVVAGATTDTDVMSASIKMETFTGH
jgi:hypothetical protein